VKKLFIVLIILTLWLPFSVLAQSYTVERVVDGDTLKLTNGEVVSLIGVDAPEIQPSEKAYQYSRRTGIDIKTIIKIGKEAKEYVNSLGKILYGNVPLLKGIAVRLKFDVQKRDKKGRLLAYVYFPNVVCPSIMEGGTTCGFLNAMIVEAGYAMPMTVPPNIKYANTFERLYQEARAERRGLWTSENIVEPVDIKYSMDEVNRVRSRTRIDDRALSFEGVVGIGNGGNSNEDSWITIYCISLSSVYKISNKLGNSIEDIPIHYLVTGPYFRCKSSFDCQAKDKYEKHVEKGRHTN